MQPNEQQCAIHRDRAYRLYEECRVSDAIAELAASLSQDTRDADSWRLLAEIYATAGYHEPAASYIQKCLQEDYTNMDAWVILCNIYAQIGGPFLDLALEQIELAMSFSEENPHIHYIKGSVYAQKGDNERAVEAFERALELEPNHAFARHDLQALTG